MATTSSIHHELAQAWNNRDWNKLRELHHDEFTAIATDGRQLGGGPDAAVAEGRMWAEAFPDGKVEVRRVYTQGNTSIGEMVGRGTQTGTFMGVAPTGKRVEIHYCTVLDLRDGKVQRQREYIDTGAILTQIGVFTVPGRAAGA